MKTAIFEVQKHGRTSENFLSRLVVSSKSKMAACHQKWDMEQRKSQSERCPMSGWVVYQIWRHVTGSAYKLRYTLFHFHFRLQGAIFNFTLTLASDSNSSHHVVRLKKMRIPLKFYIYSIYIFRYQYFRFNVRHFDFRLNADRILHKAMLLPAAVTLASSKTNGAMLNLFRIGDLRPSIQQSLSSFSHFHLEIIQHTFTFDEVFRVCNDRLN